MYHNSPLLVAVYQKIRMPFIFRGRNEFSDAIHVFF